MSVYPNPAMNSATVGLQIFVPNKVTLQLLNSLGQAVIMNDLGKLEFGAQTIDLNISQLTPGLYFLNISVGNEVISRKLSITR